MSPSSEGLTIREVASRTGLGEATLRAWESRHGFPVPERLPSGHRRYRESDVELLARVVAERDAGLSVAAAIDRVRQSEAAMPSSLFAALRAQRPELQAHVLTKQALLALTHAVEDECYARAASGLLFAAFQRERFYRQSESRWCELARTATVAAVFADFDEVRRPSQGPVEVPLELGAPMRREWSLVSDDPACAVCLVGWERQSSAAVAELPERDRTFETLWSVEPSVVRRAAEVSAAAAGVAAPEIPGRAAGRLEVPPRSVGASELQLAAQLTTRMAAYLSQARPAAPAGG